MDQNTLIKLKSDFEAFKKYWHKTEWEDLSRSKVKELTGYSIEEEILRNPETGKEFYDEYEEAILSIPGINIKSELCTSPIERKIFDIYKKKKLGSLENIHCRDCKRNKDLAGPISYFHIGLNFNGDKDKIVFIGKNSWYDKEGYQEERYLKECFADARKTGRVSINGNGENAIKTQYWSYIRNLTEKLYGNIRDGKESIAVTNMVKCNTTGEKEKNGSYDKTQNNIIDNCINFNKVIQNEIEILNPTHIVFMTGKSYDKYINSFNYGRVEYIVGEDKNISKGNENAIWSQSRTFFNKDGTNVLFTLRISHPERKKKSNYINNIISWKNNTKIIKDMTNTGKVREAIELMKRL